MLTNIQQYFRFYLALTLTLLLAIGIRLQAAPLGTSMLEKEQAAEKSSPAHRRAAAQATVAVR